MIGRQPTWHWQGTSYCLYSMSLSDAYDRQSYTAKEILRVLFASKIRPIGTPLGSIYSLPI